MLLTNLFRDQLDRYGEIDITMNILEEMIRTVPKMQVIVNADDALSAYLAMDSGNPYITYGISKPVQKSAANEIREGRFCKKCGARLEYSFYHYSQLGDYKCPSCGFARPEIKYDAHDVKVGDQLSFQVEDKHLTANIMYIIFWPPMPDSVQLDFPVSISRICFRNSIRKMDVWNSSVLKALVLC